MNEDNILKQVKINEVTISLRKDGIVHILFHKHIRLDLELQMLMLNIYKEITRGKKHPFLFEAMEGVKVTKEAKLNAIRIQDETPGLAYAVIADNHAYMLLANFYIRVKKIKMPYRVFTRKEEALEWLSGFLDSESRSAM
jgi:hypothetical protein